MTRPANTVLLSLAAAVVAGCGGGSDATSEQRVDRCLEQQPDATKAQCEEWEDAGELADDGSHKGHEDAG